VIAIELQLQMQLSNSCNCNLATATTTITLQSRLFRHNLQKAVTGITPISVVVAQQYIQPHSLTDMLPGAKSSSCTAFFSLLSRSPSFPRPHPRHSNSASCISNFTMEPLSVAASIIGLLNAAGKMAQLLKGLTALADAPGSARAVLTEVNAMTGALKQLSDYLNGAISVPAGREQLILLEHVAVTLMGCVTTYDELEAVIESVHGDAEMGVIDRLKWTLKETEIQDIVQRIQNHKISLTLMLSILEWCIPLEIITALFENANIATVNQIKMPKTA
jgi:hypothetical protein